MPSDSGARQKLIQSIYERVTAAVTTGERSRLLDELTAADPEMKTEVAALLAARDSETFIQEIVSEPAAHLDPSEIEAPGTQIGAYRLGAVLGSGGMGVVYRAEQEQPIRRTVALKIVKPGMDSRQVIARFETERQALAMMDHPNIARVFDAGSTPYGRPYFVMELVDGRPITRYCDEKRLSPRERLELFIPVCEAVQHAHQKGIIHRDLKPSNILVMEVDGKAVPKVIDFGIAKATEPAAGEATATLLTHAGTVIGSLDYMSPEQAEWGSDVDTRSDIYALGVLLYELLTGVTPINRGEAEKATYLEMLRRIRDEDPVPPSVRLRNATKTLIDVAAQRRTDPGRLPKLVHGELDWIVLKTLEKDRGRRYQTANALAADLERYLAGEPVEAGPPSASYRLSKFARKHRAAIGTAAAFLLLLTGAAIYSAREAIRARRAERVAEAVNAFLQNDLLAQASSHRQGRGDVKPDPELRVRTALDRAAERIGEGQFRDQPEVEAAIRRTIAVTYLDLGLYPQARVQAERAAELYGRASGPASRESLAAASTVALAKNGESKYAEAEAQLRVVVAEQRRRLGAADPDTLESLSSLGSVLGVEAKFEESEKMLREALEAYRAKSAESPDTIRVMQYLAQVLSDQGKFKEAEAMDREALESSRRVLGSDHPQTLTILSALAEDLRFAGNYPEAEKLAAEALERKKKSYGPDHANTISAMNNLAGVYLVSGKPQQAEPIYREVVAIDQRLHGAEHADTLGAEHNLASTVYVLGKIDEAETLEHLVFNGFVKKLGRENWRTIQTGDLLGGIWVMQGKFAQAEAMHSESLAIERRTVGTSNPNTLVTMNRLASVYLKTNRFAEAEKLQTELVEGMRKTFGPEHPNTMIVSGNLALSRYNLKRYGEAIAVLEPAIAIQEKKMPDGWQRFRLESLLGASLTGLGKYVEAEAHLLKGYQGMIERRKTIPADAVANVVNAAKWTGELYGRMNQPAKAAEWMAKANAK